MKLYSNMTKDRDEDGLLILNIYFSELYLVHLTPFQLLKINAYATRDSETQTV